jgi:hypothetical protein
VSGWCFLAALYEDSDSLKKFPPALVIMSDAFAVWPLPTMMKALPGRTWTRREDVQPSGL